MTAAPPTSTPATHLGPLVSVALHRVEALRALLNSLPDDHGLEQRATQHARDQFADVVDYLDNQIRYAVDSISVPSLQTLNLRGVLAHLARVQERADSTFSRGQDGISTTLVRAVDRELLLLGIKGVFPLLTVGKPGNYETNTAPLWRAIGPNHLRQPQADVYVFGIPQTEGSRALWTPIIAGHEVGHIVEQSQTRIERRVVDGWLPKGIQDTAATGLADDSDVRRSELLTILRAWAREVFSDLYATRRFGPAGAAALSEFLAAVTVGSEPYDRGEHPPATFRVETMLAAVAGAGPAYEPLLNRWADWCTEVDLQWDPLTDELLNLLRLYVLPQLQHLLDQLHVDRYDPATRQPVVEALAASLADGLPDVNLDAETTHADVLNAGWLAYFVRVQRAPSVGAASDTGPDLDQVDALVGKCLDTLDFYELWKRHQKKVAPPPVSQVSQPSPAPGAQLPMTGCVISDGEILRRLESTGPDRLTITPSAPFLVVKEASVDVRVGRNFITFRRTGTAAFDARARFSAGPANIQDYIEKDWGEEFILHPGELVLAATLEYVRMPADLTAQVITRSSYGRLGLLSATAVQVQPGFTGCLTLELANLGSLPMRLSPGERIAQLVFSTVGPPVVPDGKKYKFPTGPQFSRVSEDTDIKILRKIVNEAGNVRFKAHSKRA